MKIGTIDPSINEVGWAVLDGVEKDSDGVWHDDNADWRWGMWKITSNSLPFKLKEITERMIIEFGGLGPEDIFVAEWPMFFDAQRGHIAAKAGHTINLSAVDAYIAGYFRIRPENVYFITAAQWKGSVSKEITRMRFFKHMGIKQIYTVDHNAVDAVMMLLEFCKRKRITFKIISATMPPYEQEAEEEAKPTPPPRSRVSF